MQLNIKNDEAYAKAKELAALTGESLTEAVTRALEERLEKYVVRQKSSTEEKRRRIDVLLAEIDAMPSQDSRSSKELTDDLYDEYGLPK